MLLSFKYLFTRQTFFLLIGFFAIRIFSFFTHDIFWLQNILGVGALIGLVYAYSKNPVWAWYMVMTEIFLGGAGHFIEVGGISLRTLFLATYILLLSIHALLRPDVKAALQIPKHLSILLGIFTAALMYAMVNGDVLGNNPRAIVQDTIPFLFFLLLIPMQSLLKQKEPREYLFRLLSVFIVGSALFSLFTFILFSSGAALLHEPYYKWFRDIVGGKITDLKTGFFRIVTPEHLLIPPLTLIIISLIMGKEKIKNTLAPLLLCCLLILNLNFSRAYFLGIFIGTFVLLYKHSFKEWFKTAFTVGTLTFVMFSTLYFVASRGNSFGLEVFGLRLQSVVMPQIEESSYTRTALLPAILEKIKQSPLFGSGLGSTITFLNPITTERVTTSQFDWGYLELWTELGALGLLIYFLLLGYIFYLTLRYISLHPIDSRVSIGLLAGFVSLLIINITSPALFHVFGVLYITCLLAFILHTSGLWEKIKNKILRFFSWR